MASGIKLSAEQHTCMCRETYYFARLLFDDPIKTQLLDPHLVQESNYEGSSKGKNTQQRTCKSKPRV